MYSCLKTALTLSIKALTHLSQTDSTLFLKGYAMGLDWQTCGQMGSLAASYCLEQRGTQNHSYSIPDFVQRYRQNFDDQGALDSLL